MQWLIDFHVAWLDGVRVLAWLIIAAIAAFGITNIIINGLNSLYKDITNGRARKATAD